MRLGLDVVELALRDEFDVAVLFCRDQDLTELLPTIRWLAGREYRTIRLASAFPWSDSGSLRGIDGMESLPIDKGTYEACLDQHDSDSPPWLATQAAEVERCNVLN